MASSFTPLASVEAPLSNAIGINYRKLGDHRDALVAELSRRGYTVKRAGG